MTTTLYLGSYGFGNLGDELCLIEAIGRYSCNNGDKIIVHSTDHEWTNRCLDGDTRVTYITLREEIKALLPIDRVVIGGGALGTMPGLRNFIHWAADAHAPIVIHNIGVANLAEHDMSWANEPTAKRALQHVSMVSVRDHMSEWCWNALPSAFRRVDELTYFPERGVTSDISLAERIFPPPSQRAYTYVGISCTNQPQFHTALRRSRGRLQDCMRQIVGDGHKTMLVPIVSTIHRLSKEGNDSLGFTGFMKSEGMTRYRTNCRTWGESMLDPIFWRHELTPRKLKGVIECMDVLVTQRKHNAVHAIGSGVKVVGIHPTEDDSLPRLWFSCREHMPVGSRLVAL